MNGDDTLMKLITVDQYQIHMTLMTLRKSLGQSSRSASDGHRNRVKATAWQNNWTDLNAQNPRNYFL